MGVKRSISCRRTKLLRGQKRHSAVCLPWVKKHVVDGGSIIANEPDQVRKICRRRPVKNKLLHLFVVHTVDVKGDDANCYPDHALLVIEKLDGLRVSMIPIEPKSIIGPSPNIVFYHELAVLTEESRPSVR